jgi:hypothetical protein
MLRYAPSLFCAALILAGCSSSGGSERKSVTFAAGDKAIVDKLTYSVVDTQIFPRLGDEQSPRVPQSRFYVVQVSVSNSGNSDMAVPGMTLIDDSGKTYQELPDGSGVQHWLGVMRRVQANQTEQGSVVFDAPAGHYKLKLTDETDANDIYVDIPLSFAHEQMQNDTQATSEAVTRAGEAAPVPEKKK